MQKMDIESNSDRSKTEMKNMLLETEGKVILVKNQQRTSLNHRLGFCGS